MTNEEILGKNAYQEFQTRIQTKRNTDEGWRKWEEEQLNDPNNPAPGVLLEGEEILVLTKQKELRRKVGDGVKRYTQLPFTDENLRALISEQDINMKNGTSENSLVGNDIDNNQAVSAYSTALGNGTVAGGKGFRINNIDHNAKTITLEGYADYVAEHPDKVFAIDDVYTMRLNDNYDKRGTITAINGDVITVTKLPTEGLVPEHRYYIKGAWMWNSTLTKDGFVSQEINFTSNGYQYNGIGEIVKLPDDYYGSYSPEYAAGRCMGYVTNGNGFIYYVYNFNNSYWWLKNRTIDFGDTDQEISKDFYDYVLANSTPQDGGELSVIDIVGDINTFRVLDKPLVGNIDVAIAATAEGSGTKALGNYSTAEGYKTEAYGAYSHAEGNETVAGHAAHAQGYLTKALGNYSMAAGYKTQAGSMGYRITAINVGLDGNLELTVGDDVNLEPLSDLFAQGTIDKGILRLKSYYENLTIVNISNSYKQIIVTPIVTDGQDSETGAAGGAPRLSGGTGDQDTFRIGNHPEIGSELLTHYGTALGHSTQANGQFAYAEGYLAVAGGKYSHAEGKSTYAGFGAHAEGENTKALVFNSHAEGQNSTAKERAAHAEGQTTSAEAEGTHSEGGWTKAKGKFSHVEGYHAYAEGTAAHAEGYQKGVHAEKGENYGAYGQGAHVEGECTFAIGAGAHAEGGYTTALQAYSHAEGRETKAEVGWGAHAEGYRTLATGNDAHAEGRSTIAKGSHSHAEGELTIATGSHSHAEGYKAEAAGQYSHAEGEVTTASGVASHAEGGDTNAEGERSHAEGSESYAGGHASHAEGICTRAIGDYSHTEGEIAHALGETSHAEGYSTFAGTYGYKITNFTVNPPSVTIAGEETSFINFKVDNSVTELSYLIPTSESTWGANPSPDWHTRYADGYNVIIYKFPLENCQSKYIKLSLTIGREYWLRAELMTSEALNARFWDEKQGMLYYTVTQENRTQLINNSTEIDSDPSGYNVIPTTAKTFNIDLTQVKGYDKNNFASQYLLIYILDIDEKTGNGGAIRIDSNVTCSYVSSPIDLDVGDQLQIKLIKNYYIGKLDSSDGPILYLTPSAEIDFSKEPNQEIDYSNNNCSLSVIGRPLSGNIIISNPCAHAEGSETIATGYAAHAEGEQNLSVIDNQVLDWEEEYYTGAHGHAAHAEGYNTAAYSRASHAEGHSTVAFRAASHAEGYLTRSLAIAAHAEGFGTTSSRYAAHAEGNGTIAEGFYSHAEGNGTTSSGYAAHAEGNDTLAEGDCSHAEGGGCTAKGKYSHAGGYHTIASGSVQMAIGNYNVEDTANEYAFIVGNGTGDSDRKNAFAVKKDGSVTIGSTTITEEQLKKLLTLLDYTEYTGGTV